MKYIFDTIVIIGFAILMIGATGKPEQVPEVTKKDNITTFDPDLYLKVYEEILFYRDYNRKMDSILNNQSKNGKL